MSKRKVIQICESFAGNEDGKNWILSALCDDGTIFTGSFGGCDGVFKWHKIPDVPQVDAEQKKTVLITREFKRAI